MAYNNDPRIKREQELIEAEKQRKKDEKKQFRANEAMKREQMQKEIDERKAAEAKALADAEQAKKEAQKNVQL